MLGQEGSGTKDGQDGAGKREARRKGDHVAHACTERNIQNAKRERLFEGVMITRKAMCGSVKKWLRPVVVRGGSYSPDP